MFFHTPRIYKNVVNEYHDKLVQLRHEDGVHEIHEVCRCIHQSKGHDKIFKETYLVLKVVLGTSSARILI
jgi:hypothetical protein